MLNPCCFVSRSKTAGVKHLACAVQILRFLLRWRYEGQVRYAGQVAQSIRTPQENDMYHFICHKPLILPVNRNSPCILPTPNSQDLYTLLRIWPWSPASVLLCYNLSNIGIIGKNVREINRGNYGILHLFCIFFLLNQLYLPKRVANERRLDKKKGWREEGGYFCPGLFELDRHSSYLSLTFHPCLSSALLRSSYPNNNYNRPPSR
jgi:hypothetical protein